ncbi:MAG TPA: DUF1223 domain-containing protein [Bryobacteraceae bacterium]|nr:DUF1223 domain-containing protein [Bryobacteraceae bacterium]
MSRFLFLLMLPALLSAGKPVLVELFTSEGCSSCPPADALLAKLDELQPVAGVTVIALEEHVDYWDHLGWRDPFSSADFTARQQRYAESLHVESPYTPEIVIDGHSEFVGNDSHRALHELVQAARTAKTPVHLTVQDRSADRVSLAVHVDAALSAGNVWLAIAETRLSSDVAHGENAGRNLKHSAVVRKLTAVGRLKSGEPFSAEPAVKLAKQWKPENLRAVVFVQDATGKVLGAAEVALAR